MAIFPYSSTANSLGTTLEQRANSIFTVCHTGFLQGLFLLYFLFVGIKHAILANAK